MVVSKCRFWNLAYPNIITMILWLLIFSFTIAAAVSLDSVVKDKEGSPKKEGITPSSASQHELTNAEDSTSSPLNDVVTKEQPPAFTFAVWNSEGKICILAKFAATFTIVYPSQGGEVSVSVYLPENVNTKGRCTLNEDPALELSWPGFRLSMIFTRIPSIKKKIPDNWLVRSMELLYNTAGPLFDGATNSGKKTARSEDNITQFETAVGKSYLCPSPEVIPMYNAKKEKVVTARLQDVRIQAYGIEKGVFSLPQRCNQVRIGGMPEPFAQDETVPIAVGSTLAVLVVIVILGYALHRSMAVRRVDYSTMK